MLRDIGPDPKGRPRLAVEAKRLTPIAPPLGPKGYTHYLPADDLARYLRCGACGGEFSSGFSHMFFHRCEGRRAYPVLVLDDEAMRHDAFEQEYPREVYHAYTVRQTIGALQDGHGYQCVYLDHDLGTEPEVGRDVAAWLIQHPEVLPDAPIIVHGDNEVLGAQNARALTEAGRVARWHPFHTLTLKALQR